MAAASRGPVTIRVENVRETLRALGRLPKELNRELRVASKQIAADVMVPSWQQAARGAGEPWASVIVPTIRPKSDRQPAIVIGARRSKLKRGADGIMLRYPSHAGAPGVDGTFDYAGKRGSLQLSTFAATGWMDATGSDVYGPEAVRRWSDALEDVLARWNAGGPF